MWTAVGQLCLPVCKFQLQPHTVEGFHAGIFLHLCVYCAQLEGTTLCVFTPYVQGSCDLEVVQFRTVRYMSSKWIIYVSNKMVFQILSQLERNPMEVKCNRVLLNRKEAQFICRLRGNVDPCTFTKWHIQEPSRFQRLRRKRWTELFWGILNHKKFSYHFEKAFPGFDLV